MYSTWCGVGSQESASYRYIKSELFMMSVVYEIEFIIFMMSCENREFIGFAIFKNLEIC